MTKQIQNTQTEDDAGMVNGIEVTILQETVDAIAADPELGQCRFRASNQWLGGCHNRTTVTGFYGARQEIAHLQTFEMESGEPPILAGQDDGANPVEHLLNAIAACATNSMAAHAAVRGIHIDEIESEIEGDLDIRGFLGLDKDVPRGYTDIRLKFKVKADNENMEQLKRLTDYSPVVNTVTRGVQIDIQVEPM